MARAAVTLSTFSCLALPLVENESMATFGSIPSRVFAVLAVAMAMEASSSGLGLMFMAQSPNSIRPLSPYSLLGISIMKQLEMVLMPLAIFII